MGKKAAMKAVMKSASARPARAMKTMKRVSGMAKGRQAYGEVMAGRKVRTLGNLRKTDLTRNKNGKIVSKQRSARSKSRWGSKLGKWTAAVVKAKKMLNITGFALVGGSTEQGKALYAKAKSLYKS